MIGEAPLAMDRWFGWGYALAAYAVIFVGFFGYLGWLHLAQRRLVRRLDELDRRVGIGEARDASGGRG